MATKCMHGKHKILFLQSMCLKCMNWKSCNSKIKSQEHILVLRNILYHWSKPQKGPFCHTNTYQFMSSQGNVKGYVFHKQA